MLLGLKAWPKPRIVGEIDNNIGSQFAQFCRKFGIKTFITNLSTDFNVSQIQSHRALASTPASSSGIVLGQNWKSVDEGNRLAKNQKFCFVIRPVNELAI